MTYKLFNKAFQFALSNWKQSTKTEWKQLKTQAHLLISGSTPPILLSDFCIVETESMENQNETMSQHLLSAFLNVYSVLKSELLNDSAFEWSDDSRQWVEEVSLSFKFLFFPIVFYLVNFHGRSGWTGWFNVFQLFQVFDSNF